MLDQNDFIAIFSEVNGLSFPNTLRRWEGVLSEDSCLLPVEKEEEEEKKLDMGQLIKDFNHYLQELARQAEKINLWQHTPQNNNNLFVPFNKKNDGQSHHGHAFIPQYKESTIFLRLFSLNSEKGGTLRFAPYEGPIQEYCRQYPDSPWVKMQNLATQGQFVLSLIAQCQNKQLADNLGENIQQLTEYLQAFTKQQDEIDALLNKPAASEKALDNSPYFYTLDNTALNAMTGDQLATLCFEELNHPGPYPLVEDIIKNTVLWEKLALSLKNEEFQGRSDQIQTKIATLYKWQELLAITEKHIAEPTHSASESPVKENAEKLMEQIATLQFELDLLKKEKLTASVEQQRKNALLSEQIRQFTEAAIISEKNLGAQQTLEKNISCTPVMGISYILAQQNSLDQEPKIVAKEILEPFDAIRISKIAPVLIQIGKMNEKIRDLERRKEEKAYSAAKALVAGVNQQVKRYLNSDQDEATALNVLKRESIKLIKEAKPTLAKHRKEWNYLLANLSLAILSLGLGYLLAILINKRLSNNYTFFATTKSVRLLNELQISTLNLQ